jgi:hypothetical protein
MWRYAPLVEKGDPSNNDLLSCSSVSRISCNKLERETSCSDAALVSRHCMPLDIPFCIISHMKACGVVWWEYRAGKAVARGSGSSHVSCQKKTNFPFWTKEVVICSSMCMCFL